MTHEKKLSELTARIREALPRLKELSKGCFLEYFFQELQRTEKIEIVKVSKDTFTVVTTLVDGYLEWDKNRFTDVNFRIIGHEPMLNDVLEYRKNTLPMNEDLSSPFCQILMLWDLTKPYLKDQSEELIDYLWSLK